jgi:hypothetical protein
MTADFTVFSDSPCASVYLLTPHTEAARAWLEENVHAEPHQFFGQAIAVEHRYILDLVTGIQNDGLSVSNE